MTMQHEAMTGRGRPIGALVTAVLLIGTGTWILALNLGAHLPDIWHFWPVLLIAVGMFQTIVYAANPRANFDSGRLWSGLMAAMVGLLFLGISLGATVVVFDTRVALSWKYFWQVWPAFPVLAGIVCWLRQLGELAPDVLAPVMIALNDPAAELPAALRQALASAAPQTA